MRLVVTVCVQVPPAQHENVKPDTTTIRLPGLRSVEYNNTLPASSQMPWPNGRKVHLTQAHIVASELEMVHKEVLKLFRYAVFLFVQ